MAGKSKFLRNGIRKTLFLKQGGLCCYCERKMVICTPVTGQPTNPLMATEKHLKRRCEGGKSNPDNLAIACHECNHGRGQLDWLSYKTWVMENVAQTV